MDPICTRDIPYQPSVLKSTRCGIHIIEKLFNDIHYYELPSLPNFYPQLFIWPHFVPAPGLYRMRFDAPTTSRHTPSVWRKSGTRKSKFFDTDKVFFIQHGYDYGRTVTVNAVFYNNRALLFVKSKNGTQPSI